MSLHRFYADQKIANSVLGKMRRFLVSYSTSNVLVCCQTHSDYGPSNMPLELANSLSPPSIVKTESTHTEVKAAKGLK